MINIPHSLTTLDLKWYTVIVHPKCSVSNGMQDETDTEMLARRYVSIESVNAPL